MKPHKQHSNRLKDHLSPDLIINISKLSEGLHNYHLHTEPKLLTLDSRFDTDIDLNVVLDKTSTQIHLKTEIDTSGSFECDRCLTIFKRHIHTSYDQVYLYQTQDIETETEIKIISREENYIDLSEDVREFILLAIPIKLLCQEDCKGLCTRCGKNLNEGKCNCDNEIIDPRWEALSKLINKNNNQ